MKKQRPATMANTKWAISGQASMAAADTNKLPAWK
jgi:hypothetical protein